MELKTENQISKYTTERREIYAQTLDFIGKTGLILLSISFFIYAFEILDPHIPINKILSIWSLNASEFMRQSNYHGGWSWIQLIHKSDYMNYLPVALLASAVLIANIRLFPILLREKDKKLAIICLIQILVIIFSASGIIHSGH